MSATKREYSISEAQRALPSIVEQAAGGESVTIREHGRPVAQVAPVGAVGRSGARVLGGMRGTAVMKDDLVSPLDEPWESA